MSSIATPGSGGSGACEGCVRRSWLLAQLGGPLDFWARDQGRLLELLSLEDAELLEAVAGRRRDELRARYRRFQPGETRTTRDVESLCRHDRRYPQALRSTGAPCMLHVAGGVDRLEELTSAPVVALVGSRRATDYGMEMAKSLGRGLAASGVTVTSGLSNGIALAAQAGALEVEGSTVSVLEGGLDVSCPAGGRSTYERVTVCGCAVSELPYGQRGRRWGAVASARVVARLAEVTVVVEAADGSRELAAAGIGRQLGRTIAAVPGRVTSAQSTGTNALLIGGAPLVRGAQDVLELLGSSPSPPGEGAARSQPSLAPRLHSTLELVGAGCDTPEKLASEGADPDEVLLWLSELELMGLLARGDGGRYVLREALPL
jgi:DNA processing protein